MILSMALFSFVPGCALISCTLRRAELCANFLPAWRVWILFGLDVLFEYHGALFEDVLDDGRLGGVDEGDEGVDFLADADDGLEGALGLVLEVIGAVLADEDLRL